MKKDWKMYLLVILLPVLLGGMVGLLVNMTSSYQTFTKPPLAPPGYVFPIVWTILYLLMGISYYMIITSHHHKTRQATNIYWIQLGLNLLWPILFFTLDLKIIASVELLVLIYAVTNMIISFYQINKKAGLLQVPYLLWCLFASYLNLAIALLNH